jgi:uncharacterized protein DUF4233
VRRLCSTVLILESIVIGLSIPVAITIAHARPGTAGLVGGILAAAAVVLSGIVGRPRFGWALAVGTLLQLAVIATGAVVPVMYALGAIFAALWATAIYLARKYEPPTPANHA